MWCSVRGVAALCAAVFLIFGFSSSASSKPSPITPAVYKLLTSDDEVCWEDQILDKETGFWTIPGKGLHKDGKEILHALKDLLVDRPTPTPYTTEIVPGTDTILVHPVHGPVRWKIIPVPCPPPETNYTGLSGSFNTLKYSGLLQWAERLASTGEKTNSGSAKGDPLGIGLSLGYGFRPFNNSIVVQPFVAADFPNIKVNQTFPSGSYLGTRSNYDVIAGVKFGPTISNVWLYGIAGGGFLNEKLTINFIPLSSSTTTTVGGGALGVGAAIMPEFMQRLGRPISLHAEYQHEWWGQARYNAPAASPTFNYTFNRQDNTFKFGFSVY
jgi:hypothetical protein